VNKNPLHGILAALLLAGCGSSISTNVSPTFITATLPPTGTPAPVSTAVIVPSLTAEVVTIQPIEGVTTTQLNLRSEPSTAGESLGTVAAFSTVQIVGRESNGKWYQILNSASSNGKGWIIAAYVQINGQAVIPIIDLGATGLIVQGVNVRSGPDKNSASLGTLVPNDVVRLTGKDPDGAWLQINYKENPGWIASEFTQVQNAETLTIIESSSQGSTASPIPTPNAVLLDGMADHDSLESPIAFVSLNATGVGRLQLSGYVSLPKGDQADWVQFTAIDTAVSIHVKCPGNGLRVDLYQNGLVRNESFLACNEIKTLKTASGQTYTLKLTANAEAQSVTNYSISVSIIR
jgi:uncharacterized protein YraI